MADTVRVHRLRLRAARAAAPGLAARVEDALRTASRPPALAHAFLQVKRLRLVVPGAASAQGIALQLEREWARLLDLAVPLARADDTAEVVWAASEGAARQALLQCWLRGEAAEAWFWHRLAPRAGPGAGTADRIAALLATPWQDEDDATAGPPRWWRDALPLIDAAGHTDAVMARLPAGLRLRIAVAWQAPWRHAAARAADRPPGSPGSPLPEGAGPAQTPGLRRPPVVSATGPAGPHARGRTAPGPAASSAPVPADAAPLGGPVGAMRDDGAPPLPRPGAWPRSPDAPPAPVATGPDAPASAALPLQQGLSTAWAGLWFLLPLLQRAGFAADAPGPRDAASQRWAALWALLLQQAGHGHAVDQPLSQWIDARADAVRQALPPADLPALQTEAAAWLRRTRLACVRDTRLPLRRVLRRRGEALLAPHRWDIVLPLPSLDVRIRRAGLDIDPGYVPWLDTIVRFHYA